MSKMTAQFASDIEAGRGPRVGRGLGAALLCAPSGGPPAAAALGLLGGKGRFGLDGFKRGNGKGPHKGSPKRVREQLGAMILSRLSLGPWRVWPKALWRRKPFFGNSGAFLSRREGSVRRTERTSCQKVGVALPWVCQQRVRRLRYARCQRSTVGPNEANHVQRGSVG